MKSCAISGHRPSRFSFGYDEENEKCIKLKKILEEQIRSLIKNGICTYHVGMACGVDLWCSEIILSLKKEFSNIKLIACIPFEGQANMWSVEQRDRYFNTLALCDEVITLNTHYTKECMFERNRYMVDNSDYLLAVYDGNAKGGTFYTINYARKKSKEIIIIDPNSFKVSTKLDFKALEQRSLIKLTSSNN